MEDYFYNIKSNKDIDFKEAKKKILTVEQALAYKKLTEYRLKKTGELHIVDELFENYYLTLICMIKAEKIIEYVEKHCK